MAKRLSTGAIKPSTSGQTPFKNDISVDLDKMSLDEFQTWSMPSLKAFLSLRKRSVDGSFDELAAR